MGNFIINTVTYIVVDAAGVFIVVLGIIYLFVYLFIFPRDQRTGDCLLDAYLFMKTDLHSLRIVRLKNIYYFLSFLRQKACLDKKYKVLATGGYCSWHCFFFVLFLFFFLFLYFLFLLFLFFLSYCSSLLVSKHYSALCTMASHTIFLHS